MSSLFLLGNTYNRECMQSFCLRRHLQYCHSVLDKLFIDSVFLSFHKQKSYPIGSQVYNDHIIARN
jgi:hypothetical protein